MTTHKKVKGYFIESAHAEPLLPVEWEKDFTRFVRESQEAVQAICNNVERVGKEWEKAGLDHYSVEIDRGGNESSTLQ